MQGGMFCGRSTGSQPSHHMSMNPPSISVTCVKASGCWWWMVKKKEKERKESLLLQSHVVQTTGFLFLTKNWECKPFCVFWMLTVLWTLKSDREAISLSSSSVADVADGFAELKHKTSLQMFCLLNSREITLNTGLERRFLVYSSLYTACMLITFIVHHHLEPCLF